MGLGEVVGGGVAVYERGRVRSVDYGGGSGSKEG